MDWKDYEEITKHIYETLGKAAGVKIECYGKSCKIKGKSSVEHQVDVLTSHSDGIHIYKTAIECKYWQENINKDIVMKVADIIEDAGINKGVIVSKNGFTPDAIKVAKYRNIGLVELREMTDEDWKGRIRNISISINLLLPQINGVTFQYDTPTDFDSGQVAIDSIQIQKSDGSIIEFWDYVEKFNSELVKQDEDIIYEKNYPFEKGSTIVNTQTTKTVQVSNVTFSGVLRIAKDTVNIIGENEVWLIMKSIFEDKTYTINPKKEIRERKDDSNHI